MSGFISTGTSYAKGTPLGVKKALCIAEIEECGCNDLDWCQPVIPDEDTLAFQFKAPLEGNVITGEEINTFADFSSWFSQGWTFASNPITGDIGALHIVGTNTGFSKLGVLTIGAKYKVVIKVIGITAGSLSMIHDPVQTMIADGEYTFFFTALGTILDLNPTVDFDGFIDYVRVWEVAEDFTIDVIDSDGNVDAVIPGGNINQFGEDVIVSIPWDDLALDLKDCYNIRVFDDNSFIEDTFDTGNTLGWTLDTNTTIDNTLHYLSAGAASDTNILSDVLEVGCEYRVTYDFTVDPITPADGRVRLGTALGILRIIDGTYVEDIICTGNTDLSFLFSSIGVGDATIDNLIIAKLSKDGQSECVNLQSSFTCDLKFKWTNNENAFAHNYEDDPTFFHEVRLCGNLRIGPYPQEKVIDLNSDGNKGRSFGDYRKAKNLQLEPAPEYIHDALVSMMNHDNWFIDDLKYTLDGDYEADSNNEADLFGAVIEIEETEQPDQKNFNC